MIIIPKDQEVYGWDYSKLFKSKIKIIWNTPYNDTKENAEIPVLLKYLINF